MPACSNANKDLGSFVESLTELQALGFSPGTHMGAKGFGIVHGYSSANAYGDIDVFGAKVMEGVWNKPNVVDPRNVRVTIFQGHGDNGKAFFRAGVEHARPEFQQLRAFEGGAFREDHNAHAF